MATSRDLCKARNCLARATHRGIIVVKPFHGGAFPVVLETPLTVCVDHTNNEIAASLMTDENFKTIKEVLTDQGFKDLTKRQLEVNFVRLPDPADQRRKT